MSYGKLITRFTTGGHDIFITCPAKSMHLEPEPVPQKACTESPSGSRCMFFAGQVIKISYPSSRWALGAYFLRDFGLSVHAFCGTGYEGLSVHAFCGTGDEGLSVHAFCGTGDENIIPTCHSADNYYIKYI